MLSKKKTVIMIITMLIISIALSFIPYNQNTTTINATLLLTCSSGLFGVSLAILTLLFTIIDRYKEKVEKNIQNDILERSLPILKNISDDVLGILIIIILLFLVDLLSVWLQSLQNIKFLSKINIERCLLIFSLVLLIVITIDITIVIVKLINGLFYVPKRSNDEAFELSLSERNMVLSVRNLDSKRKNELFEYIKTLIVKQEINKEEKR